MSSEQQQQQQPVKLLICGRAQGKLDELCKRIRRVQRKQQFDLLFCVGDFFGETSSRSAEVKRYTSGESQMPLPTFVASPIPAWAQGECVPADGAGGGCELGGIVLLGRRGVFTGRSGLKVAYLSGVTLGESDSAERFSREDTVWLLNQARGDDYVGVDLLLTSAFPTGALLDADTSLNMDEVQALEASVANCSHQLVAAIARSLRPRYHVAGCGVDWQRPAYRNHCSGSERARHVTRFMSLADVGSERRYLYALQLVPLPGMDRQELLKEPSGTTDCPYSAAVGAEQQQQFFFGKGRQQQQQQQRRRRRDDGEGEQGAAKQQRKSYGACWFCLGNPEVQRHLVVSVAKATYLALPRGGLVEQHVLILPIAHHQSLMDCPPDVVDEVEKYKRSIADMYRERELAAVFYERNFKCHHCQIQCVPVPMGCSSQLKAAFLSVAESHGDSVGIKEIHPGARLADFVPVGVPYFYAELPNGERLFCRIQKQHFSEFPLSFGRDVLASDCVYNCPERIEWRQCAESEEQEAAKAEQFKRAFAPFDFSL